MKQGKRSAGIDETVSVGGLVILSLLREAPKSGYDLLREFERQSVSDWAQLSKSQVYYLLRHLQALGYVQASSPEGVHRRAVFAMTEAGNEAMEKQLSHPSWLNDLAPSNFMTWMGLAVHAPEDAIFRNMARRRDWLINQIEAKVAVLAYIASYPSERAPYGLRIVRLYLTQLRAELEWIDGEIAALNAPHTSIDPM